jgi:outer membrane protein TolC
MFKTKKLISFISIISLFTTLNAKDITLKELIDLAIQNNSNIKISQHKEEIKKANLITSKAAYLPKLSAQGELAIYDIKNNGSSVDDIKSSVDDNVTSLSLTVNQLIYDFGKTSSNIESAKKDLEASFFETITNITSIVLKTKQAYYSILNNYQQINLAQESIKIDKLHLNQANSYYEVGVRTLIDVTDAKLKLSNSKLKLVQSKYSLKNSKTKLISILGLDNISALNIKSDMQIENIVKKFTTKDSSLNQLIENGYKNRSELKMYKEQILSQKLKLKRDNKEYYPKLDFDASYSDKNSDKIASIDSRQTTAGIYLKWDFYTGGTTKANIKSSLANLNTLKQQRVQQKLQIKEDITSAYFKVKENQESINIALLSVQLATQKLDLANQRYEAGLNDLVEVSDSKLQYTQSKSDLINTYYSYLDSKASLDYATGIIY